MASKMITSRSIPLLLLLSLFAVYSAAAAAAYTPFGGYENDSLFWRSVANLNESNSTNTGPVTKLTTYPNARCLDGSSSGFYHRPARNATMNSTWFFVLDGGGICTHASSCLSRAKTILGSSVNWTTTFDFNSFSFTSDDARNPLRDGHLVFVPYCDGSMHTGQQTTASNDTFGLYFSGHLTIAAVIDYFATSYSLNTAGNVVVFGGGSAGGVGVFNNYEWVSAQLPLATVVGAPVGGFPPEVFWYTEGKHVTPGEDLRNPAFAHHVKLYDSFMNQACVAALRPSATDYLCILPYIAYRYLSVPIFIIEALTDSVVLVGFEGVPDSKESLIDPHVIKYFNEYGHNATNNLQQVVPHQDRDGIFAAGCLMHTGFLLDKPLIRGLNAVDALYGWLQTHIKPTTTSVVHREKEEKLATDFIYMDHCLLYYPLCNLHCPPPN